MAADTGKIVLNKVKALGLSWVQTKKAIKIGPPTNRKLAAK